MFRKDDHKLESIIGESSTFKGNVTIQGTLRIDGAFEGDIEADRLIVGEKSRVKGNVRAQSMIIGGLVDGNLWAKETVEIKLKGQVNGDISTARLLVHEGGILNGKTTMQEEEDRKLLEFHREKA
jgi:cytoskeletal protein CcmA (bactofilin family)